MNGGHEDCPFCHPDIERVFAESDDLVVCLWDGFPVSPGHALVVTRRHVATWFDATPEEQQALFRAVDGVRSLIEQVHQPDAYNIGVNAGAAAGQTIDHLHLHVIPRYAGDVPNPRGGVRNVIPGRGDYLRETDEAADGAPDLTGTTPEGGLARASDAMVSDIVAPWPVEAARILGNAERPLLYALRDSVETAAHVDVAVAFVLEKGLQLILPLLANLVERGGRLRFLTGDYLDVTEPRALRRLLDLQETDEEGRVECRVFETSAAIGFHPKSYLVHSHDQPSRTSSGCSSLAAD